MELFDIIELRSYVTPLAERLRIAVSEDQKCEESSALPPAIVAPKLNIRRDWTSSARDNAKADLILSSSDAITFQVHRDHLLAASTNGFNEKLSACKLEPDTEAVDRPTLVLPYSSVVLNVLLRVIYKEEGHLRVENTSLVDVSSAIHAFKDVLAFHCQLSPSVALEVCVLAASHAPDLHHIAVHASRFLLSIKFSRITDEIAAFMGPTYLLRLCQLLTGRTQEFKRLLLPTPQLHKPVPQCDTRVLREAWTLVTAFLMWHAAPDLGNGTIDGLKDTVIERIRCKRCNDSDLRL
ncbi:hypothetical protein SCHPADRAFT_935016 [Schizopora paradoxa]|uniref:Uncharacterized protein n=1 Tax=Schizopora paradoxa TaxID=27342 RepID=A0A0H2SDR4_9AGAM|nr:hypothetical protein SCHPADRAFT_935016 [Schizopora paradoxa]